MSLRAVLEHVLPARMRAPSLDADALQALRQSKLIQAQVRQWALESELYRRRQSGQQRQQPEGQR